MALNLDDTGLFSEIDLHFARFMTRLSSHADQDLFLAIALTSRATGEGNVCLDLRKEAGQPLAQVGVLRDLPVCPELSAWVKKLRQSDVVGSPGDETPLILDQNYRLYLLRYWEYEHVLIQKVREWVTSEPEVIDEERLKKGLSMCFTGDKGPEPDWQEAACLAAATKHFCVISGGPGTGKSTVVSRILALLALQSKRNPLRLALAAPTGKAAQRLQEAIRSGTGDLPLPETIRQMIPLEASTIHRLLGFIAGSPYFRHHADNPLSVDGIVVDEASMVDLPLMSKLVQALSPRARIILLGDQDQLASVEAGAVLGDLCDRGAPHHHSRAYADRYRKLTGRIIPGGEGPAIQDSLVRLRKNYRFGSGSGIGAVSQTVNRGAADEALEILKSGAHRDCSWVRLPEPAGLARAMKKIVLGGFRNYLETADPREAFYEFERFQMICALRKGPYGVIQVNRIVERVLKDEHLIRPASLWYRGRPVLITRNDYTLDLFNGDMGLILPDQEADGALRAFFKRQDGSIRKIHPVRLPQHETVFAMTVHKSQGSEFEEVVLLLPDQLSLVVTRELIYTGLTRARKKVEVWGREDVFAEGVKRRIERSSGLREAFWGR